MTKPIPFESDMIEEDAEKLLYQTDLRTQARAHLADVLDLINQGHSEFKSVEEGQEFIRRWYEGVFNAARDRLIADLFAPVEPEAEYCPWCEGSGDNRTWYEDNGFMSVCQACNGTGIKQPPAPAPAVDTEPYERPADFLPF